MVAERRRTRCRADRGRTRDVGRGVTVGLVAVVAGRTRPVDLDRRNGSRVRFNGAPQRLLCMSGSPCPECPDPSVEELSGTLRRSEGFIPGALPSDVDWYLVVDAEASDAGAP